MKQTLLIDISNSRTKLAVAKGSGLGEKRFVDTPSLSPDSLAEATGGWAFEKVVLCSVVPEKNALVEEAFAGLNFLLVTHLIELGVAIDYPDPSSIGADRLANAAATASLFPGPAVAIDFGTAVTFDVLSSEKSYVGGVITPGLEVMSDYMVDRTALLPKIDLVNEPSIVGKSTRHAMQAGAFFGYRGLIREILQELRKALGGEEGSPLDVVATGGYAALFSANLPEIGRVEDDLTMQGLRIISDANDF
ncbi:MAG: type III pantothenate kinase [Verrucomicrobiota bacterium]